MRSHLCDGLSEARSLSHSPDTNQTKQDRLLSLAQERSVWFHSLQSLKVFPYPYQERLGESYAQMRRREEVDPDTKPKKINSGFQVFATKQRELER
jgi:hypothetical protein